VRPVLFWGAVASFGVLGVLAVNLAADRVSSPGLTTFRNYLTGRQ
jgi:hypothetical protein